MATGFVLILASFKLINQSNLHLLRENPFSHRCRRSVQEIENDRKIKYGNLEIERLLLCFTCQVLH